MHRPVAFHRLGGGAQIVRHFWGERGPVVTIVFGDCNTREPPAAENPEPRQPVQQVLVRARHRCFRPAGGGAQDRHFRRCPIGALKPLVVG